jgi:hypothetical protein
MPVFSPREKTPKRKIIPVPSWAKTKSSQTTSNCHKIPFEIQPLQRMPTASLTNTETRIALHLKGQAMNTCALLFRGQSYDFSFYNDNASVAVG